MIEENVVGHKTHNKRKYKINAYVLRNFSVMSK